MAVNLEKPTQPGARRKRSPFDREGIHSMPIKALQLRLSEVALLLLAGSLCAPVSCVHPTGRYTLEQTGGRWQLVSPDGVPRFVVALNHLANPFYSDVIQGAAGLGPCRSYDAGCLRHNLLADKYDNNWTAATLGFVAHAKQWGFNAAGYEFVRTTVLSYFISHVSFE